jgi:hypothetical protein
MFLVPLSLDPELDPVLGSVAKAACTWATPRQDGPTGSVQIVLRRGLNHTGPGRNWI